MIACDAGRRVRRDDDPDWMTPCPNEGTVSLFMKGDAIVPDMHLRFCPRHLDQIPPAAIDVVELPDPRLN